MQLQKDIWRFNWIDIWNNLAIVEAVSKSTSVLRSLLTLKKCQVKQRAKEWGFKFLWSEIAGIIVLKVKEK